MDYKKAYQDLLTADRISLKERVAMEIIRKLGYFDTKQAETMMAWVGGVAPVGPLPLSGKRAPKRKAARVNQSGKRIADIPVPPRKTKNADANKPKRKYTKKSKFWKNPKRAPWGSKKK